MGIDNTTIARRFMEEIWSKGNLDIIGELVATDMILRDGVFPEGRGHEFLRTQVRDLRTAFPDLRFTVDEVLPTTGDRVLVRWTCRGTHRGPLLDIAPTGRSMNLTGVDFMRIVNGKIVENNSFWDSYGAFQQLGVVPSLDMLGNQPIGSRSTAGSRPEVR